MAKPKTQVERMKAVRKEMPPPGKRFVDRKKAKNKKACRGKVQDE